MKEVIRQIFMDLGADVCGVTNVDRFIDAPAGFHPTDIYSKCKSLVVFAKAMPKGTAKVSSRIIYQHFNTLSLVEVDRIAYLASLEIERQFHSIVVPIPADCPYDYWVQEELEGKGTISMKHAAVLAGIGTLGKNTLLLNREYGNMLAIGAVLLDLDLESDSYAEDMCISGCHLCLDNCPGKALNGKTAKQAYCRPYAYGKSKRGFDITSCNNCRVICPMAFGVRKSNMKGAN